MFPTDWLQRSGTQLFDDGVSAENVNQDMHLVIYPSYTFVMKQAGGASFSVVSLFFFRSFSWTTAEALVNILL